MTCYLLKRWYIDGRRGGRAFITGVVCARTRFEGMVWGQVRQDGWNATDTICKLLEGGKFLPQLHIVLLDGIAFGGFNIVDLPKLQARLGLPSVAVIRRNPNLTKVRAALGKLSQPQRRLELLHRAGEIYAYPPLILILANLGIPRHLDKHSNGYRTISRWISTNFEKPQ